MYFSVKDTAVCYCCIKVEKDTAISGLAAPFSGTHAILYKARGDKEESNKRSQLVLTWVQHYQAY